MVGWLVGWLVSCATLQAQMGLARPLPARVRRARSGAAEPPEGGSLHVRVLLVAAFPPRSGQCVWWLVGVCLCVCCFVPKCRRCENGGGRCGWGGVTARAWCDRNARPSGVTWVLVGREGGGGAAEGVAGSVVLRGRTYPTASVTSVGTRPPCPLVPLCATRT